jgi:cholinesterase
LLCSTNSYFAQSAACLVVQQTGGNGASNPANLTAAGFQIIEEGAEVGIKMSEDCLTLNVWTKPQIGESEKAVMLWIYGGAFTSGYSAMPLYNGQYIADQEDVVIVSIKYDRIGFNLSLEETPKTNKWHSYRINIFGFPGSTAGAYNVGLLDQRLAVEWVRDNIAAFGGDPSRITLFGQSAGAASIDFYTYAWTSDPIVNGFIEESGTTSLITPLNISTSAAMWYNVSSTVGCGSETSNASSVLACMRNVSSTAILAAIGSQSFTPTIDSTVVFSDYGTRSLEGNLIKKPLLLGNNDNEAGLFRVVAILEGQDLPQAFWDAYNFKNFFCPCAARANVSVYNQVPTWRYRWFGVFPNTNLTTYPDSGAYHTSEIPIVFNTPAAGKGIVIDTAQEQAVMNYTRGAWAAFAKDPINGLNSYQGGWPAYNPTMSTLVRLAFGEATGTNLALPEMYDAPCGTIFPITAAVANGTTNGNMASTSTSTSSSSTKTASSGNAISVSSGSLVTIIFTVATLVSLL